MVIYLGKQNLLLSQGIQASDGLKTISSCFQMALEFIVSDQE
jgi:hypothetical protein